MSTILYRFKLTPTQQGFLQIVGHGQIETNGRDITTITRLKRLGLIEVRSVPGQRRGWKFIVKATPKGLRRIAHPGITTA